MLGQNTIVKIADLLQPDDFYVPRHGRIFLAARNLYEAGSPIDVLTMADELKRMKALGEAGGEEFLAELQQFVPTSANLEYYAQIVKNESDKRKLIAAGSRVSSLGYDETMPADQAVDKAESIVFEIGQGRIQRSFVPIKTALRDVWAGIEKAAKEGETVGVPSGFYDLDDKTGGFQNGNLVIVAGRPGFGKTSFVLNIAQHASLTQQIPVGIFSLEMSEKELVTRMLCNEANVDSYRLRKGMLKDHEWPQLAQAIGVLSEAKIFIEESPILNIYDLRTRARRFKAENELGLIIVDYLQLMSGRQNENRVQEVSEISRSLKGLARELDIPIIACSQLSREPEKRTDHRPMLADLRESGSIEQDADIVIFIYRERFYDSNLPEDRRGIAEIIIAKHRNGEMGKIELRFIDQQSRFQNIEHRRALPQKTSTKQLPSHPLSIRSEW